MIDEILRRCCDQWYRVTVTDRTKGTIGVECVEGYGAVRLIKSRRADDCNVAVAVQRVDGPTIKADHYEACSWVGAWQVRRARSV
ncbi:MAG: hypothetical protein ACR2RE_23120 [Geminicoccaceae bacterium]